MAQIVFEMDKRYPLMKIDPNRFENTPNEANILFRDLMRARGS